VKISSAESINAVIIGASGYAGSELARLVAAHPALALAGIYVSKSSNDAGKPLAQLYPRLRNVVNQPLQPLGEQQLAHIKQTAQVIFIATEHDVAAQLVSALHDGNKLIVDLSGAHRLASASDYERYYGFEHPFESALNQAVYGLAEWSTDELAQAQLIAVPGCYPTASLLALKPLASLLANQPVIINAVSGVTGAGRKPKQNTLGAELSLQAYGVFSHRHQPEIERYSAMPVVFTPHLGNFKRGILASIYATVADDVSHHDVEQAFSVYQKQPCVRVDHQHTPAIQDVEHTGYCDIGWQLNGRQLIVFAAIDNLLKGAASQAVQCVNIRLGLPQAVGLPL
jgi:N-acetyl-gamma-glutamyl-phosphate reductase